MRCRGHWHCAAQSCLLEDGGGAAAVAAHRPEHCLSPHAEWRRYLVPSWIVVVKVIVMEVWRRWKGMREEMKASFVCSKARDVLN